MNFWSVENGMPDKTNARRLGADPSKNVSRRLMQDEYLSKADAHYRGQFSQRRAIYISEIYLRFAITVLKCCDDVFYTLLSHHTGGNAEYTDIRAEPER